MEKNRILIVDDEPTVIEVLTINLEDAGYAVRSAANGKKALKLLPDFTPDLIITDISMPDMEGIEFLRRLRKENSNVPVIVMSGNAVGKSFLSAAMKLGARESIKKPFSSEQIIILVEKILK